MLVASAVVALVNAAFGGVVMGADAVVGQDGTLKAQHVMGEPLTTDISRKVEEDFIKDPVDRIVTKFRQSAVPLDQICRIAGAKQENGMRFQYYSVDTRPIQDAVASAVTAVAVSSTSSQVNASAKISVYKPEMWDETDLILVDQAGFTGTTINTTAHSASFYQRLILYVTKVESDGITVQAFNGSELSGNPYGVKGIPAIAKDTELYRIGHASSEGEVQSAPYSAVPVKEEQFMQIFKAQVQLSSIQIESDKEVDWNMTDLEEINLTNFRREEEAAFLFGEKAYLRNEISRNYVYTCKGIFAQLLDKGQTCQVPTLMTESSWIDICKTIFTGNSGAPDRYVFVGSGLMAKLSKIESISRQIDATASERIYGYTWTKVVTNFGTLHFYLHPLLDEYGYTNYGLVIDTQYLSKRVFRSLTRDILDLKKAGIFDGDATVLTEISSIVLKYPKCHKLLYPQA